MTDKKKTETKTKEKKCPFGLSCQECKFFIYWSKDIGKECVFIVLAKRNF